MAFLLCVGFGGYGVMRKLGSGVVCPLTGRYVVVWISYGNDLVLVALDAEQIAKAKNENGKRKQITHALVFGNYGVMFGTEKQCMKYYSVWKDIFKDLFGNCYETDQYHLSTYISSGNVVMDLIEASDRRKSKIDFIEEAVKREKKGFWAQLFGH